MLIRETSVQNSPYWLHKKGIDYLSVRLRSTYNIVNICLSFLFKKTLPVRRQKYFAVSESELFPLLIDFIRVQSIHRADPIYFSFFIEFIYTYTYTVRARIDHPPSISYFDFWLVIYLSSRGWSV